MPTEVKGATKLRKALREYEPDLAKETTKELGNLLKPIAAKARGFMPAESPLSAQTVKVASLHIILRSPKRVLPTKHLQAALITAAGVRLYLYLTSLQLVLSMRQQGARTPAETFHLD
jgi:hypothetical protein